MGLPSASALTVDDQRRTNRRTWTLLYLGILALSGLLGMLTLRSAPAPFSMPMALLLLSSIVITTRPAIGVYVMAFFALLTDGTISPWYPFMKNFSSAESILYLNGAIPMSPFEVLLLLTTGAFFLRLVIDRSAPRFVRGRLFNPMMLFAGFLFAGFAFGLVTGGDRYTAIWEFRPLLYLPLLYVLITNLLTTRRHYFLLAGTIVVALVGQGILGSRLMFSLTPAQRELVESPIDHSSAVQLGALLMAAIAAYLLPRVPRATRRLLLLSAIPVTTLWLIAQRRAAVIGVAVCIIFLFIILGKLSPKRLRVVGPIFLVLAVGYLGAFWGSTGLVGFPAQAVKSVIAPSQVSDKDQSSDLYRVVENYDLSVTIHAKPLTGLGFGQKFYRPIPLPDISFFPFYEYIPHNSILWIWVKTGVGGFIAMLYLMASALRQGVRAVLRVPTGRDAVLCFAAAGYVVMYVVFAYVDIAWDPRSMISLAFAMSVCSEFLHLPDGRAPTARPALLRSMRQVQMHEPAEPVLVT
jgi:hypothetical protein